MRDWKDCLFCYLVIGYRSPIYEKNIKVVRNGKK